MSVEHAFEDSTWHKRHLIIKRNLSLCSKIMELEEELKVVGNSLKSLEVSEEKVSGCRCYPTLIDFRLLRNRV